MGGTVTGTDTHLIDKLNGLSQTSALLLTQTESMIDVFAITLALMVGTAGLPHVIVRFFTVKRVKDARNQLDTH
jgi:cation/acetate symporter